MPKYRDVVRPVMRTPESERWIKDGFISKSDKELLALLNAFGVCRRCAHNIITLIRTPPSAADELMPDEAVGIPVCSKCVPGITAAMSAQQH
jgi:hypothetical protein